MRSLIRKKRLFLLKKKIQESNEINRLRLSVLKEREDGLKEIFEETKTRLQQIASGTNYPDQLRLLILQGVLKMKENDVLLQCREADRRFVEDGIPRVIEEYERMRGTALRITVYTQKYLPSDAAGGVLLSALGGKIRCNNTFEARLRTAYELALPDIRRILYGTVNHHTHVEEHI